MTAFSPSDKPLVDSGYTDNAISAIVRKFLKAEGADQIPGDSGLMVAMCLGLAEGDVVALSQRGTVMLPETRDAIDARIARARDMLAAGMSLPDVLPQLSDK